MGLLPVALLFIFLSLGIANETIVSPVESDEGLPPEICGGPLTGNNGSFSSPEDADNPSIYMTNITCFWHLIIPDGSDAVISFSKFKTEGCCDYVKLTTQEGVLIGQFSGITTPNDVRVSSETTRMLDIVFHSDPTVARQGFTAHYTILRHVATSAPPVTALPDGLSLVSTFQTISNALSIIIHSTNLNLVSKNTSADQVLEFKNDLSDALASLLRLRSVSSHAPSKDEQKQINIALKHLNARAKQLVERMSVHVSPSVCRLPKKVGTCRASFTRWFYDKRNMVCRRFIFGGCGGNNNNFMSKRDCEALCKQVRPKQTRNTKPVTAGL